MKWWVILFTALIILYTIAIVKTRALAETNLINSSKNAETITKTAEKSTL